MIQTLYQSIESLVIDFQQGKLVLPKMQRGYVWKSTQVRDLFDSLYHEYPSGQLLVWDAGELPVGNTKISIDGTTPKQHSPHLLLDGQQRLTSLIAIILGRPLIVRDMPKDIDIVFNVFTEKFEVAGPKHTIQNNWVSLRRMYSQGAITSFLALGLATQTTSGQANIALERLSRLENIKKYQYHVNVLLRLSYVEVTRIFVRTNSGGTKLGNADLALAQISSIGREVVNKPDQEQDDIVDKLVDYQGTFKKHSWGLKLDNGLLLRAIVVLITRQSRFSRMFRTDRPLTVEEIDSAWERVKKALELAVSFLVQNCLIDHLEMLPTRNLIIPLIAFFDRKRNHMTHLEARGLQRWVYMALIWTRYSASSESAMDQDIAAALSEDNPIQAMIQNIENEVGRRPITEQELQDQRKNSPYMVMAYVLARQAKASDWFNGIVIANSLKQQEYHIHHIFPKSKLRGVYDLRRDSRIVDQVANLAFITAPTNKSISDSLPEKYLINIDEHRLHAQYIPMQHDLWKFDQFENFVRQRRVMLANAINQLLLSLSDDKHIWTSTPADILEIRVDALEKRLRKIAAIRLTEVSGAGSWEHLVSLDIRNRVSANIKKYEGNNPFTVGQHETLEARLGFCLFSDLFKIVQNNLIHFDDIFGKETAQFSPNGQYVINVRNAFKHHQQVLDADLAHAEAGLLWFEKCLEQFSPVNDDEDDMLSEAG